MSFVPIKPPAGFYRNGTEYQSKGRWADGNLMRFAEDQIKPVGGWQKRSTATAFSGKARAIISWRDNSNNRWIAVGTHSKLYVQSEVGANTDITPVGFTSGRADASQNLAYGGGAYGVGTYGTPRTNTSAYLAATVWTLDTWGEYLVGCSDTDGKLYKWTLSTGSPAAVIAAAPTSCKGLVVTPEDFIMALGASGNGRRVAWCDQQDDTNWTASSTNQAGDQDLQTAGTLVCGRPMSGQTLLLTDVDAWSANYLGPPLVYGFHRVGSGCGIVAKGAIAARDSEAVWMGRGGVFWLFNGQSVQPLDCDVQDYAADMNPNQVSKVTAVHLAGQGEVWWFFPSSASNENDRYVCWAYRESQRLGRNVWTFGEVSRLAGSGKGVYPNPLMVDSSGYLYEHETGWNYDGAWPFLETGPIEIGKGDYFAEVTSVIPDEGTAGQVSGTLYGRMWPNGAETTYALPSLASPTDILFQAREIRLRLTGQMLADWRVGVFRLDIQRGDPI
jgi:hypothetical protein